MKKTILVLLVIITNLYNAYAQCGTEETHAVCDMTIVDGLPLGAPDGIVDGVINLYDVFNSIAGTTLTAADGTWFDPNFNFALNSTDGNLFLWDLDQSSEQITDYQFQFLSPTSGCPDDVEYLLNIVLGPYSGDIAMTSSGGANIQVCQTAPPAECESVRRINLFRAFQPNPSPHTNGTWIYNGSSPNFIRITENRFLEVNVPYVPGPPLVDEETFEVIYRVPGQTPCDPFQESTVVVSVVREPFAGFGNSVNYCATEIPAGEIDLLDDDFLVNENIEGLWTLDIDGQITSPADSRVNLNELYQDLILSNPRFGSKTYDFTYTVESRSTICNDQSSAVNITLYEEIKPFSQDTSVDNEFCANEDGLTTIDLYDYIEFTTENIGGVDVLFDYPNDACTNWSLVSGPSDLGLETNQGDICSVSGSYTSRGTIDLSNLSASDAGTYTFEFTVDPNYNASVIAEEIFDAPDGCTSTVNTDHPCEQVSAQVTIVINPYLYAGEITENLELCSFEGTLTLTDLLNTNGVETVYQGPLGTWINLSDGSTVSNQFIIPEIIDQQDFNFRYTTLTDSGCMSSSTLSFTIYEQYDAGVNTTITICQDDTLDLFDILGVNADSNGTWSGPNGYSSNTNEAQYDAQVDVEGNYVYTVPANGVCASASATVVVVHDEVLYAGEDTLGLELCFPDLMNPVDLITLITTNGTDTIHIGPEGVFRNASATIVSNPIVIPPVNGSETYSFTYTTTTANGCEEVAVLNFTVFERLDPGNDAFVTICPDGNAINLFDELLGTPSTEGTWTGPGGFTSTDNNAIFDPTVNEEGDYIYSISSSRGCAAPTATVSVFLNPINYAGEDTTGVEICVENPGEIIDLRTLIETDGTRLVYTGFNARFIDNVTGQIVVNPFVIPDFTDILSLSVTYNTSNLFACRDNALLEVTFFEQYSAGSSSTLELCSDDPEVNIFDFLNDDPDVNGTWVGPNGYNASGSVAMIDPQTAISGDYVYTVPANNTCASQTAVVSVQIEQKLLAGDDVFESLCPGDYEFNLNSILTPNADLGGIFIDVATNLEVINGLVDIASLSPGNYSYLYLLDQGVFCASDSALLDIEIQEITLPEISAPQFCVADGATLQNIEVIVGSDERIEWFASINDTVPLSFDTLLIDGENYWAQTVNDFGCRSTHVMFTAQVLSLGEGSCDNGISDGISVNGDGVNDQLDLGRLIIAFPNFKISVFNRYGSVVYEGVSTTTPFQGMSNAGLTIGDRLPSGVYYYIFNPNDGENQPFSGNFYLSR